MNFQHDVFISYAHLDNQPALEGHAGWITDFHHALSVRVSQIVGRELDVWRDPKLSGNDMFPQTIKDQLPHTAVLVSVLSPRYVKSTWCTDEFGIFCDACNDAGGIAIGDKARIFKVVKTPLSAADEPDRMKTLLRDLLGYEFYRTDPDSGKFREFSPEVKQDYWVRLDDLAQDIAALLGKMVAPDSATSAGKPVIYIAETSQDLKDDRAAVRRDLERRGYRVLPSRPLPLEAEELNSFLEEELSHAALSVHMIGARYGVVPDGSEVSTVEIQLSLAERRVGKNDLVRLVWMAPGLGSPALEVRDIRNQTFVDRLRSAHDWGPNADLLEMGIENLKTAIDERLRSLEEAAKKPPPPPPAAAASTANIYLMCDQQDRGQVKAWQDFLFNQGFEITLPLFDGDETEMRSDYEEALQSCDGVVVFYGAAGELFLRKKLRDLQKCAADRKQPMLAKAICIAPPVTADKSAYRTHDAMVIPQPDGLSAGAWADFLTAMKG
jgi:TIR domain